jgi:hypothetical protein
MNDAIEPRHPAAGARALTLLVVDDHEVVSRGPVVAARPPAGFQVVAQAGTVARRCRGAAVPAGPDHHGRPSPGRIGHRGLSRDPGGVPNTPVVMLTSYPDERR